MAGRRKRARKPGRSAALIRERTEFVEELSGYDGPVLTPLAARLLDVPESVSFESPVQEPLRGSVEDRAERALRAGRRNGKLAW